MHFTMTQLQNLWARRGKNRAVLLAVGLSLVLYSMTVILAARIAGDLIESRRHNIAGLALQVGDYSFSILRASLTLKQVKIFPVGQETDDALLASAGEVYVRLSLFALFRERLHVTQVTLIDPKITYIVESDDHSNWIGVKPIHANIVVDDIEIKNADVMYEDKRHGMHLELQNATVTVNNIRPAHREGQLPTSIEFSAGIAHTTAKLNVKGDASLFGDGVSFDVKGSLRNAPVGLFAAYYRGMVPFPVIGGVISMTIHAQAMDNKLTSSNHVTLSGLRVGGGLEGEIANKFILSQAGPISFNVNASGDLSTGDFSVATTISKNIAGELVSRAMGNGPHSIAKDVDKNVLNPIKKGLKNLFKSR
jgi:hypothetical protein